MSEKTTDKYKRPCQSCGAVRRVSSHRFPDGDYMFLCAGCKFQADMGMATHRPEYDYIETDRGLVKGEPYYCGAGCDGEG